MKIERNEAFTAGIVHDMGKIILDAIYADSYREVLAKVAQEGVGIYQAEDEIIGLTHRRIGEELAETWNLSPDLIAAIAHHHLPKRAEGDTQIAHLIHVGDCVTRKLGVSAFKGKAQAFNAMDY